MSYRWYDAQHLTPAFPFGYGLSYTSFRYEALTAKSVGKDVVVQMSVTNSGKRSGTAVPQLYVSITIPQLTTGAAGRVGLAYYAASKAGGTALTAWVTQTSGRAFVSAALSDPKHPTYNARGVSGPTPRADYVGAVFDSRGRLWAAMVRQGAMSADGHTIVALGIVGHLEPRKR